MRVAITVTPDGNWAETVTFVREAERLGVSVVGVPEAWGYDAAGPLGYLAAVTDCILRCARRSRSSAWLCRVRRLSTTAGICGCPVREAAGRVQHLWLWGRRKDAAAAVPDEMVL